MTVVPFEISWWWRPRQEPSSVPAKYGLLGASALFIGLHRFLGEYEGRFTLRLGSQELYLRLEPDLSTIFRELPAVLTDLARSPTATAELYFFEQGIDTTVLLERSGGELIVRFRGGLSTEPEYAALKGPFRVPVAQFLTAWTAFAREVLAAVVAVSPELADDEDYHHYQSALDMAASAA